MQKQSLKALQRERFLSNQRTNMMLAAMTGTQGTVIASYVMTLADVITEGGNNKVEKKMQKLALSGKHRVPERAEFCLAVLLHLNCAWKL